MEVNPPALVLPIRLLDLLIALGGEIQQNHRGRRRDDIGNDDDRFDLVGHHQADHFGETRG